MHTVHRTVVVVVLLAIAGLTAYGALAVVRQEAGRAQVLVVAKSDDSNSGASRGGVGSTGWAPVPGASVALGSNEDLVLARFSAQSLCVPLGNPGTAENCYLRIVAARPSGATVFPLLPPSDVQVFDSIGQGQANDRAEMHAMDRFRRLASGAWIIRVEFRVQSEQILFGLKNWTLRVDVAD